MSMVLTLILFAHSCRW